MPAYHLHRLSYPGGDPEPAVVRFFEDDAAMRWAMGAAFPEGCDIWQGQRYVGRVHRPSAPLSHTPNPREEAPDSIGS